MIVMLLIGIVLILVVRSKLFGILMIAGVIHSQMRNDEDTKNHATAEVRQEALAEASDAPRR